MGAMTSQPWPSSGCSRSCASTLAMSSPTLACSSGRLRAARHGIGRQVRRAVGEIEGEREEGDEGRDGDRHRRAPEREGGAGLLGAIVPGGGAGEQAARDLGLGGGRLGLVDQPPRALGFDLVELVAIDGERAGLGARPPRAPDGRAGPARRPASRLSALRREARGACPANRARPGGRLTRHCNRTGDATWQGGGTSGRMKRAREALPGSGALQLTRGYSRRLRSGQAMATTVSAAAASTSTLHASE